MRVGKYKIFESWAPTTAASTATARTAGGKENVIYHDPPLIFGLDADPGEATPLTARRPTFARAKGRAPPP